MSRLSVMLEYRLRDLDVPTSRLFLGCQAHAIVNRRGDRFGVAPIESVNSVAERAAI